MVKSKKTTASGIVAALGAVLVAVGMALQGGDLVVPGVDLSNLPAIGAVLLAVGTALQGVFARDDDVSSEGRHLVVKGNRRGPE
jgi:hypothetical protein